MSRERKAHIDKDRVKKILETKGISQRKFCSREYLDCNYYYFNRCLKNGLIGEGLFYKIARKLDIAPDYLSGEYTPDIDSKKYKNSEMFYNDLISYSSQFNRDAVKDENAILRQITLLCGMDKFFYDSLSDSEIIELRKRIFNAVYDYHFELSVQSDI